MVMLRFAGMCSAEPVWWCAVLAGTCSVCVWSRVGPNMSATIQSAWCSHRASGRKPGTRYKRREVVGKPQMPTQLQNKVRSGSCEPNSLSLQLALVAGQTPRKTQRQTCSQTFCHAGKRHPGRTQRQTASVNLTAKVAMPSRATCRLHPNTGPADERSYK